MLIQAKEYYDSGHTKAKKFLERAPQHLKTQTARNIWERIGEWDSSSWWERS